MGQKKTPADHAAFNYRCKACNAKPGNPCMRPRGVPARAVHKERITASEGMPYAMQALEEIETPDVDSMGCANYFMVTQAQLLDFTSMFETFNPRARWRVSYEYEVSYTFMIYGGTDGSTYTPAKSYMSYLDRNFSNRNPISGDTLGDLDVALTASFAKTFA